MPTNIDEQRFGRDLFVPLDPGESIRVTPTGDLPSQAGAENYRAAIGARAITSPGDLLHRPTYGAGLLDQIETASTPAGRARLANTLRRGLLADPRTKDARVTVSAGLPDDPSRDGTVTVDLAVQPRGQDETISLTLTAAE